MKAKIRSGGHLLFSQGASNDWSNLKDKMIVNFMDRYIYQDFHQNKNHLFILTSKGLIDIVFSSMPMPKLKFDHYEKDQLVLKIVK